ncbi:unnamed protein product [Cunninghamella blakesleeana]
MTDYLFLLSQAKLAEYYGTTTDKSIRKYVLIANMLKKASQEKQKEEQWLDDCLDGLDEEEYEIDDDDSITDDNEEIEEMDEDEVEKTNLLESSYTQEKQLQNLTLFEIYLQQ